MLTKNIHPNRIFFTKSRLLENRYNFRKHTRAKKNIKNVDQFANSPGTSIAKNKYKHLLFTARTTMFVIARARYVNQQFQKVHQFI